MPLIPTSHSTLSPTLPRRPPAIDGAISRIAVVIVGRGSWTLLIGVVQGRVVVGDVDAVAFAGLAAKATRYRAFAPGAPFSPLGVWKRISGMLSENYGISLVL